MQAISLTLGKQKAPYHELGFGVALPHARHQCAAAGGAERICHSYKENLCSFTPFESPNFDFTVSSSF